MHLVFLLFFHKDVRQLSSHLLMGMHLVSLCNCSKLFCISCSLLLCSNPSPSSNLSGSRLEIKLPFTLMEKINTLIISFHIPFLSTSKLVNSFTESTCFSAQTCCFVSYIFLLEFRISFQGEWELLYVPSIFYFPFVISYVLQEAGTDGVQYSACLLGSALRIKAGRKKGKSSEMGRSEAITQPNSPTIQSTGGNSGAGQTHQSFLKFS